jgi:two-component system, chemotaxis family, chemotaxis protein CheY
MYKSMEPEALRILVVDDSEISRRIIGTILRSRHWTVCGEAEDGKDGVKKFRKLKPDVVLLDLSMPDMTGIEAAQQMSASNPTIPLILFTILDIAGLGAAAHKAGIQAIIPKSEAWSLITLLLADDANSIRSAVRLILETEPAIELIGEAMNFPQAWRCAPN